jgi:hypothetical protein
MPTRLMLKNMCHNVLNGTDMRAICKARRFPKEAQTSPTLLESFFLSDAGVEAAASTLTPQELILIHLLNFADETVDITFFSRLYGNDTTRHAYSTSFTQRHKETLKQVQRNLVRKGILLMAEKALGGQTKMERWRFKFPKEFAPFLPPIFPPASNRLLEGDGNSNQNALRKKIGELLTTTSSSSKRIKRKYELNLLNGQLYIGERPFKQKYVWEWQRYHWQATISPVQKLHNHLREVAPSEFVAYAFDQLKANEWIQPDELSALLKLFYYDSEVPKAKEVCEAGWKWGYLAKQSVNGLTYYRPIQEQASTSQNLAAESYLEIKGDSLIVGFETIPYEQLEYLNLMAKFKVVDGWLTAKPDLGKIGNVFHEIHEHPLTLWLRENMASEGSLSFASFDSLMKKVEEQWGEQIIHQNLLVARIKDFSLKVRLEQTFAGSKQIVLLSDEWIAFPRTLLPEIEKAVKKNGHLIKTVQANG